MRRPPELAAASEERQWKAVLAVVSCLSVDVGRGWKWWPEWSALANEAMLVLLGRAAGVPLADEVQAALAERLFEQEIDPTGSFEQDRLIDFAGLMLRTAEGATAAELAHKAIEDLFDGVFTPLSMEACENLGLEVISLAEAWRHVPLHPRMRATLAFIRGL